MCVCAYELVCLYVYIMHIVKMREMCLTFTIGILVRISVVVIKTMTKSFFKRKGLFHLFCLSLPGQ